MCVCVCTRDKWRRALSRNLGEEAFAAFIETSAVLTRDFARLILENFAFVLCCEGNDDCGSVDKKRMMTEEEKATLF